MDHQVDLFDELAKDLARGVSRREALRRLGGGMAGAMLASLGVGRAWGQGNSDCAHFCDSVYPPGRQRGECKSDAAHGQGICQQCGPAAPPGHGPLCGTFGNPVCCDSGQLCVNGLCNNVCTPGAFGCNGGSDCFCNGMTIEGFPFCHRLQSCEGLQTCTPTLQCPVGYACAYTTCRPEAVCIRPCL